MTPRDVAYLSTVHELANGDWCQVPRGRRLDVSGLSWGQWRGAQAAALERGHVEIRDGADHAKGEADAVRLTPQGVHVLHQHRSAQVQHRSPAQASTPLRDDPTPVPEKKKGEHTPPKAPDPAQVQHTPPAQVSTGGVVVLELGPLTRAAFVAAFLGVPLCSCGLPMVERERGKDGAGFLCCVKGKAGCGATSSLPGRSRRAQPQRRERGAQPNDPTTMSVGEWKRRLQQVADEKGTSA